MNDDREIWVLGAKNPNASKSFSWDEEISNLADADIIIVNLQSLDENMLEHIEDYIDDLSSEIKDKSLHGGIIILISNSRLRNSFGHENYDLCPLRIYSIDVAEGTKIKFDQKNNPYSEYLKTVKKFDFYFSAISIGNFASDAGAGGSVETENNSSIMDNSGHALGGIFYVTNGTDERITGEIIILPPPTNLDINEAINKIIHVLQEDTVEPLPSWISQVNISGLEQIKKKLDNAESNKSKIEEQISTLLNKKNKLEKYYGLLYAQDKQLEKIVRDAFKLLGFDEIRRERNFNDEDWIIDLKSIKDVEYGVIEVKGRKAKTSQADIVQCNKWVDDYLRMEPPKNTKGVLISNQFRSESYPTSKTKRTQFEPNELSYAKGREICIIPSYVLFEAVNNALEGKTRSREEIEKLIFETNGILTEL